MSNFPSVSGKEAVKAFKKLGYWERGNNGDHVILKCEGRKTLSVPLHNDLSPGTLRKLIKDSGCTKSEFQNLL